MQLAVFRQEFLALVVVFEAQNCMYIVTFLKQLPTAAATQSSLPDRRI